MKRVVCMNVLPGEPLDGSGKVCIHLYVQDESGPFIEPHALHPVFENGEQVKQKMVARPTRGRLACNPKRDATTIVRGKVTTVTHRTDDPRAVTCSKCKASEDYMKMMLKLEQR